MYSVTGSRVSVSMVVVCDWKEFSRGEFHLRRGNAAALSSKDGAMAIPRRPAGSKRTTGSGEKAAVGEGMSSDIESHRLPVALLNIWVGDRCEAITDGLVCTHEPSIRFGFVVRSQQAKR